MTMEAVAEVAAVAVVAAVAGAADAAAGETDLPPTSQRMATATTRPSANCAAATINVG
jgi:hypothetical protein